MKVFQALQIREATAYAADGGQALHLHEGAGGNVYPNTPLCFARAKLWAHLMDQDRDRLVATARRLGVRRVVVGREGHKWQHVDLCGVPLERAFKEAQDA